MHYKKTVFASIVNIVICAFLIISALLCLFPLINVLSVSLSSSSAASAGIVKLWPVQFTLSSYEYVASKVEFWRAFGVSLKRVSLGIPINMLLTILTAYPLSRSIGRFKFRKFYAWFFVITMLFNGGLIPTYMTVSKTGLLGSIWSLVIPGALPIFNVIVLLNFFKGLPNEIEEAAFIDGAGHWVSLWRIYVPLSTPALATLVLFVAVAHWNSWFDGLIFINKPENYPLQSYLQTVIVQKDYSLVALSDAEKLSQVSDRTIKAAQVFVGAIPILAVYPYLQKYFMTGLVLGSVKG